MIVLSVCKCFHYNHLPNVLKVIMLSCFPLPTAQNLHPPMAPSPTPPNATETGSTASWTSSPACCPSPRRSGLGWTSCPCSASASDTWRSRASSTVSARAVDLSLKVSPRTESPGWGHKLDREFCLLYKVVQYTNTAEDYIKSHVVPKARKAVGMFALSHVTFKAFCYTKSNICSLFAPFFPILPPPVSEGSSRLFSC